MVARRHRRIGTRATLARRHRRIGTRALTLSATAAGAGASAGIALQLRHRRRIERDGDFRALNAPLGGRAMTISSADGTRLHAEAFGPEAGQPVVLVHGWTERLTLWGPVIRRLSARGMRIVAYDLRGHGASGLANGDDYALQRFGEDVEAVLAAVTTSGERATVVGRSLGAMSIAAWAERHDVGARVGAAALINTGLGDLIADSLVLGQLAKRVASPVASRLFLGSRLPIPSFSSPLQEAVIRYVAFGPTATPAQVTFYERMLIACPPAVRAAAGIAMSEMNLWHAVARLTVPTLVVTGENDRLTPSGHGRRIAETLPQLAELIELAQTGHMSPLERPDELSEALTRLVEGVAGAAGVVSAA